MSYLTQKTVKNNVSFDGVALHSGLNVNVCIKPAEPNFGIVFKRVDLKNNNFVYFCFKRSFLKMNSTFSPSQRKKLDEFLTLSQELIRDTKIPAGYLLYMLAKIPSDNQQNMFTKVNKVLLINIKTKISETRCHYLCPSIMTILAHFCNHYTRTPTF